VRFSAQIWPAVLIIASAGRAFGAEAVFEGEFWNTAVDVERVEDFDACADAVSNMRRSIHSTATTNVVTYELRVGDVADAGEYELWVRLRMPESATRTILVGQDVGGTFTEPQDRFVITTGAGESGFRWVRATRQGSGSSDNPELDPWLVTLTESPSDLELRLVDTDVYIDRLAVSNAVAYAPPSCPPYVGGDGGPTPGDGDDWISGARDANCEQPDYFDLREGRCVTPSKQGCAAAPVPALAVVLLLARRRPGKRCPAR
jgi:hypothetical protein